MLVKTLRNYNSISRYLIYGLCDRQGAIRYIGRSSSGIDRPQKAKIKAKRGRTLKDRWIRSLNGRYRIVVLEECDDFPETHSREIHWIAEGRRLGWRLLNSSAGGK